MRWLTDARRDDGGWGVATSVTPEDPGIAPAAGVCAEQTFEGDAAAPYVKTGELTKIGEGDIPDAYAVPITVTNPSPETCRFSAALRIHHGETSQRYGTGSFMLKGNQTLTVHVIDGSITLDDAVLAEGGYSFSVQMFGLNPAYPGYYDADVTLGEVTGSGGRGRPASDDQPARHAAHRAEARPVLRDDGDLHPESRRLGRGARLPRPVDQHAGRRHHGVL